MRKIILASQSSRRQELLTLMGVPFETMPSDFYEALDDHRSPEEVAMELGLGKAMVIARQHPEALVIGSDTIVTIDGTQLAKPDNLEHAREMLRKVAKYPNKITSSLAVVCLAEGMQSVQAENSYVYFKPYDSQAAEAYLATGDYADKAGGYGVQSGALPLIEKIEGNLDTIVGLPTHLLAPLLRKLGYDAQAVDYKLPEYS
jgi:septum formation protein